MVPSTVAVDPRKLIADVVCVAFCSATSVVSLLVHVDLLLDAGKLHQLLGELIGVSGSSGFWFFNGVKLRGRRNASKFPRVSLVRRLLCVATLRPRLARCRSPI